MLFTSAGLVAYGSYRAFRFAERSKKWIGVLAPALYMIAWLLLPVFGSEVAKREFPENGAETPMWYASVVWLTSYALMTVAAIIGMLCIRFFVGPEDLSRASHDAADHDEDHDASHDASKK